jgi:hypothetical protein
MRSELILKIIDISIKNSLLIGFLQKLTPQVYMYAFVNTSDMDHPNVASCGTSRRVRNCLDPAHLRICEYLRHGPSQRGLMWNKSQGQGLS